MNIRIWNYGDYKVNNYGSCIGVTFGRIDLYFSYKTVIAFRSPRDGLVISENDWGPTTGRHLNAINRDHSVRLPREEFEKKLNEMMRWLDRIIEGGAQ